MPPPFTSASPPPSFTPVVTQILVPEHLLIALLAHPSSLSCLPSPTFFLTLLQQASVKQISAQVSFLHPFPLQDTHPSRKTRSQRLPSFPKLSLNQHCPVLQDTGPEAEFMGPILLSQVYIVYAGNWLLPPANSFLSCCCKDK